MIQSIERFRQFYDFIGQPYEIVDGKMFRVYKHMAGPFGPAKMDYSLSANLADEVLRRLGTVMVRVTRGFRVGSQTDWYAVICDKFQHLADMPSKHRNEVRRGLKNCEIRRIDADFLCAHGYEVFAAAQARYEQVEEILRTEPQFKDYISAMRDFDDVAHFWGAFHGDRLIAFGANNIFGTVEATYWMIKLHPEYLKLYPGYALIYRMNEYYLRENGFEYVNDGWRSILHTSHIQDYLIRKFGFRKAYSSICVRYRQPFGAMMRLSYPFRSLISRLDPRLRALYELERIQRACESQEAGG